jgi:hypothetical protein
MVSFASIALLAALLPQQPAGEQAQHWAYRRVVRPQPPVIARTAIDSFIAAKLPAAKLVAARRADRATLVRRLYLDVIGLPPTLAERDAFLSDQREGAYQRLVDRLLASPHYGERWAVPWLDLARYGDTNGYNLDRNRSVWPYRDWLIDALNRDMPFDQFTIEQLAGDMLPDADESTRIATGFHRHTMLNNEGGVDPKEARWERLLDRASTTGTTWLGSTLHCAQCHDHKYDPVSQREFYGLVAFFETQDEVALQRRDGGKTLVLRERPGAEAVTRLRLRGAFDSPGEAVPAHLPAAFPPKLEEVVGEASPDRLALARWIVSPDNALTPRVAANRIWMELLGQSLIDTPEDFGLQAKRPLHGDLLDWLATEYVRLGWSQKQLIRTILLSDVYRRSAVVSDDQRGLDPDNRFYARASRFRLDAERIRDTWLVIAGLLSRKLGGPSVYPLQADTSGVVPTNKVIMRWPTSKGGDRWRRGLYTYWRRTAPFVAFKAFDAPSREVCQVQRERSNTPMQALVGLNDPTALAAAGALARRMSSLSGDLRAKLQFGFMACTAREPSDRELDSLRRAWESEPSERAWHRIAIVLLNLDETLSRG